jgi:hypothetical protein
MMRLVLALLTRASARTLRATPAERVTLCRNGLTELGMERVYTTLHQPAPSMRRNDSGTRALQGLLGIRYSTPSELRIRMPAGASRWRA